MSASNRATDEIRTRPRPELLSSPINKLHGNQLILQHRSRNLNASRVIRILFKIAGGTAASAAEGHETRHRPVEHQVRGGENHHSYRITANSFSLFFFFFCLILFLKSALPSNTIHRVVQLRTCTKL